LVGGLERPALSIDTAELSASRVKFAI